jgi:hypothetical protein
MVLQYGPGSAWSPVTRSAPKHLPMSGRRRSKLLAAPVAGVGRRRSLGGRGRAGLPGMTVLLPPTSSNRRCSPPASSTSARAAEARHMLLDVARTTQAGRSPTGGNPGTGLARRRRSGGAGSVSQLRDRARLPALVPPRPGLVPAIRPGSAPPTGSASGCRTRPSATAGGVTTRLCVLGRVLRRGAAWLTTKQHGGAPPAAEPRSAWRDGRARYLTSPGVLRDGAPMRITQLDCARLVRGWRVD